MKSISVPTDFARYPEFIRLRRLLVLAEHKPASMLAESIFLRLWVELSYLVSTDTPGCILKSDMALLSMAEDEVAIPDGALISMLVASKMLKDRGDHYLCRTFLAHNEDNILAHEAASCQLGPKGLALHKRRTEASERLAAADARALPAEFFSLVDDTPVTPEQMNRALALVRVVDGILEKPERALDAFGVGVVHDAVRVVRRFPPPRLDLILRRLMAKRRTPELHRTSERLLENFDATLSHIEPEAGWQTWSLRIQP